MRGCISFYEFGCQRSAVRVGDLLRRLSILGREVVLARDVVQARPFCV